MLQHKPKTGRSVKLSAYPEVYPLRALSSAPHHCVLRREWSGGTWVEYRASSESVVEVAGGAVVELVNADASKSYELHRSTANLIYEWHSEGQFAEEFGRYTTVDKAVDGLLRSVGVFHGDS